MNAEMKIEVHTFTPAEAAQVLAERNTGNRIVSPGIVNKYATDMLNGDWQGNGETIKYGPDGQLLDGQHRLLACAQSGVPLTTAVVYLSDPEAQKNIDRGKPRSFSEHLKFSGFPSSKLLAAVLRRSYAWEQGYRLASSAPPFSDSELERYLYDNPDLQDAVNYAQLCKGRFGISGSVAGSLYFLLSEIDRAAGAAFCASLLDGAGLAQGSPALALRNRVIQDRLRGVRTTPDETMALGIIAWNFHRQHRLLRKLQLPKGGLTLANYPEVCP